MTRVEPAASVSEARRLQEGTECARCGAELRRSAHEVRLSSGTVLRCLRCALIHPTMVQRSLLVALAVGTLLTAINQGNIILQGDFPAALVWKVPLTYAVPFCVATTGAILNARRPVPVNACSER